MKIIKRFLRWLGFIKPRKCYGRVRICYCGDEMGKGVCLGARDIQCKEMPGDEI